MIKRSTVLLILVAMVLGGAVYYFDWKNGENSKPPESSSKPAFSIQAGDITSMTLAHPAQANDTPIRFEKQNGAWQIAQPVETAADESTIEGLVDQIAGAQVAQSEPGTEDRRKAYGLDPAQVSIEFQLRTGARHTLLLGNKDFTGDFVYTVVDGGQSVSLLPVLILTSAGKSVDDLRDRDVLHIDPAAVSTIVLKNPSGELDLAKQAQGWKFTKPGDWNAGEDSVDSLLQTIATARMASIASEKPEDLARYGLSNPAVTLRLTDGKGAQAQLLVGKKDADGYFARDAARPMIFRISDDVYQKLAERPADLRDKKVLHLSAADIRQLQIHGSEGAIGLTRKGDSPEEWAFDTPDSEKGKSAAGWKIVDALADLSAEEIIDRPAASILAQLKNPAFTAVLTDKSGKSVTVRISKPSGDFVYAQTSEDPAVYKLAKKALDDLNWKPSDLTL